MSFDTAVSRRIGNYPSMNAIGDRTSIVIADAYIAIRGTGVHTFGGGRRAVGAFKAKQQEPRVSSIPKAIRENWTALAMSGISTQKYAAIYKIAGFKDGWRGPKSLGLQSECLRQFLKFWLATKEKATTPHLSLSPKGHLIAQWYKNSKRNLMLEFMTNEKIYIGLQDGEREYDGVDEIQGAVDFLLSRSGKPLRWR